MNTYLYKLKTSVVLCLLIGLGPSIYSQNKDKSETFSQEDKLTSYFDIISRIPQEKLYLQLDKPYYGAGESIWFKGYLVNAITHIDNTRSNFITVELIAPQRLYHSTKKGKTTRTRVSEQFRFTCRNACR